MLQIDITPFEEGLHTVVLEPAAEDVDLDPSVFHDVEVEARLDIRERRILVLFDARATARLECDRTLEPFDQPVEGAYSVLFAPPEQAERLMQEDEDEDVRVLHEDERVLDITDAVRDTLLLALPARRVAPGAEDAEIPTTFGALETDDGTPIDPRWEALRALKSDEDAD